MGSFQAKYAGFCGACGERFSPGARVVYVEGGELVHAGCADPDSRSNPRAKKEEVCSSCWLVKPCECEEKQ